MRVMCWRGWACVGLMALVGGGHGAEAFRLDFEGLGAGGEGAGEVLPGWGGTRSLKIRRDAAGTSARWYALDPGLFAGGVVTLSARVRASSLGRSPNRWNGVKVTLVLDLEDGRRLHPQLELPMSDFDWAEFREVVRLRGQVVRGARLMLGLEQASGEAWFDDIAVIAGAPPREGRRQAERFRGHALPRLRGVMHGPRFEEANFRDLAQTFRANQVRWQLNWTPMHKAEEWARDLEGFDRWLESVLPDADKAVEACERYGIRMLLDLHTPPGGRREKGICRMFQERRYQDKLVSVWEQLARRYKGRAIIYAYDLLNEPVEGPVVEGCEDWRSLATRVTRAIRAIEPGKPVAFEPAPWGGPDGFDGLVPLDLDRVIYSFHMYRPHLFTHQGVREVPVGAVYPGEIGGERWDKARMRHELGPAIEFGREFNVAIHVGEFSAIRWAPEGSAHRWLRDAIELFEEYGWDWTYHAYREWDGWSVEHGEDPKDRGPSPEATERMRLLLHWFGKN